jgi:hypothetical protein
MLPAYPSSPVTLNGGVWYTGAICDEKTPILSLACHIGKGGAGQKCVKSLWGKVLHEGLDDPDTAAPPRKARQGDAGIATSINTDG